MLSSYLEGTDHVAHKCSCGDNLCNFCGGGLFMCIKCGSAEGATTSQCPGEMMDGDTQDKVYSGEIDYVDGEWVNKASKFSPKGIFSKV